jgi:hypothetical protein
MDDTISPSKHRGPKKGKNPCRCELPTCRCRTTLVDRLVHYCNGCSRQFCRKHSTPVERRSQAIELGGHWCPLEAQRRWQKYQRKLLKQNPRVVADKVPG